MRRSKTLSEPRTADSVSRFLEHVGKIRHWPGWFGKDDVWEPWFRGHPKDGWQLRPTLYRGEQPSKEDLREREDEIREEFIKRAPILCEALPGGEEMRTRWEWYFMMQHHRAATRLLDWTDGALIALYFAVKDNHGDDDAAVWVLDPYELNKRASKKAWAKRGWVIPPTATSLEPSILKDIAKWLPKRFARPYEDLPPQPLAIEPTHVLRRMSSQRSCFTIHGSDPEGLDKLVAEKNPCLCKIIILKTAVKAIERELRRCGIDESTIFPDLDGLGRSINARWQVGLRDHISLTNEMPHAGVYARIRQSKTHGVGVFAIRNIPKGTKIFSPDDTEVVWKKRSALKLNQLPNEMRSLYNQFCLIKDKGKTYGCPKSFNTMTVAWYLNHSKTPNVGCDTDYVFFARRDITKGEELTADYYTYNEFANANWV